MKNRGNQTTHSTDTLTVEIVDALEDHDIDHETYTLHDHVDLDALEGVLSSENADIEVRLAIEGVQLRITRHGVEARDQPSSTRESSP